jgi:tetratricopeptide (TPR) repeat protein
MALNLAELEEELKQDPKSRRFYDLAREYQKLGRLDEALGLCEKGLTFHPSQWQSRILLAQLYLAKGRLEDARQMAEKVLLPLPDNVPANHLAADIYRALGNNEKALRHFKIVELLEPGRAGVRDYIAELSIPSTSAPLAEQQTAEDSAAPQTAMIVEEEQSPLAETARAMRTDAEQESTGLDSQAAVSSVSVPEDASASGPLLQNGDGVETEQEHGREESEVDWGVDTAAFDRSILEEEKDTDAFDAILPKENETDLQSGGVPSEESEIRAEWRQPAPEEQQVGDDLQLPEPSESEEQPEDSGMSTVTLAELYERQGYPEKAVEIYQRLLLREPDNQSIHDKIDQLMKRLAGEAPEGPPVHQEDVERALRRKRVSVLQDWLRRVREGSHV